MGVFDGVFREIDGSLIRNGLGGSDTDRLIVRDIKKDMVTAEKYGLLNIEINYAFPKGKDLNSLKDNLNLLKDNWQEAIQSYSFNSDSTIKSLDFLKDYTFITGITIVDPGKFDITSIGYLQKLKQLFFDCPTVGKIDFSTFKELEYFGTGQYQKSYKTIFNNQYLKELILWAYKVDDLTTFSSLPSLEKLTLNENVLLSLNGISKLPALKELRLIGNRKITAIDVREKSNVEFLSLYGFTQLKSFSDFENFSKLKTIKLQNCPHIESIRGLNNSPQLEALALFDGTKVTDGDVSILKKLKKTWLQEFKHYNVKKTDLTTLTSELAYM
jgi:hypothetical protein